LCEPIASRWFRHATVAARILALFVPVWIPALLLYPSVNFYTDRAVRDVIASQYAGEARTHTQALQERLAEARREIDALPSVPNLVVEGGVPDRAAPRNEAALFVWRQTALARYRLTSAIELYAEVFAANDALDRLEAFASCNGAAFYGLPRNADTITLTRMPWRVPSEVRFGDESLVPFRADADVAWRIESQA
jgi:hypothetical protein